MKTLKEMLKEEYLLDEYANLAIIWAAISVLAAVASIILTIHGE